MSTPDLTEAELARLPPEKQALARKLMQRRAEIMSGKATPVASAPTGPVEEPGWFEKGSASDSALKGYGQGLTFNFGDELAGVLGVAHEALGGGVIDDEEYVPGTTGQGQIPQKRKIGFLDRLGRRYNMESESWRKELEDAEKANPNAYLAGELVGAVTMPLPGAGTAAKLGGEAAVKGAGLLKSTKALEAAAEVAPHQLENARKYFGRLGKFRKYGGLAGEGALAGAIAGAGAGEGVEGTLEGAGVGGVVGGAMAPAVSAAGGKTLDLLKSGGSKLSSFFGKEAEREMSRSALGKSDIMHLPYEQRLKYARKILNMVDDEGKPVVRAGDNADELFERMKYVQKALGVKLEDVVAQTDAAIGKELNLPTGSAPEVQNLRARFKEAEEGRLGIAKQAADDTAHHAEALELQRLRNWLNSEQKRSLDRELGWKVMDRSAREVDAVAQHDYGKDIGKLSGKSGDIYRDVESPGVGVESIKNQYDRLQKWRDALAEHLASNAPSNMSKNEVKARTTQYANELIKSENPLILGDDFSFGGMKLKDFHEEFRKMVDSPYKEVADNLEGLMSTKKYWSPTGSVSGGPGTKEHLNYLQRGLAESGRTPMVWDNEVAAGLRERPAARKGEPWDTAVEYNTDDLGSMKEWMSAWRQQQGRPTPTLRSYAQEAPMTAVPAQSEHLPFHEKKDAFDFPKVEGLSDKQIWQQAKEFGKRSVPNVQVEADPKLLDGIGVDIKPIVNTVRNDLMQMVRAPNLQGKQEGLETLARRWEELADKGTSLSELVKFKGDIDAEIANFAKADIDDKLGIKLRGTIDDLVEKEIDDRFGKDALTIYRNLKDNYGALSEYIGGLNSKSAANNNNRGMSLTDNIAMGAVGNALLGGAAAGGLAYDANQGRPGIGTAIAMTAGAGLGNRVLRQRAPTALAKGYDAISRGLEDAVAGVPLKRADEKLTELAPEFREKMTRFLANKDSKADQLFGRKPTGYFVADKLTQSLVENKGDDRPRSRNDQIRAAILNNPGAFGPSGTRLMRAILEDANAGSGSNKFNAAFLEESQRNPNLQDPKFLETLGIK